MNKEGNSAYGKISTIIGLFSFLGGFIFFPLPIIGLIFGLCEKEKSNEKTIGIILNSVAIFFFILISGIIISLVSFGVKFGKEIINNFNEEYVEDFDIENDMLDGTWYSKDYKIKMYNNTYIKYEDDIKSKGVFIIYDISESEVSEEKLDEIKSLVDGVIIDKDIYYVVMSNSKNTTKNIWIRIDHEEEYFVYHLDNDTYEYLNEKEYE